MANFPGFEHGMGMGGWLTNYKRFVLVPEDLRSTLTIGDFEHFEGYITRRDIDYIASLGMDHIRLGFDQLVIEEKPGQYRDRIWYLIDSFLDWCADAKLNVVLNLHKAIGNYCDLPGTVSLLDDSDLQERFIAMWVAFEKRYHDRPGVVFEVLNEVLDVPPEKWNALAARTIAALRALNPDRKLIIGSTCYNSCTKLKDLALFDDPNVIYTFHCYMPFEFTHQRGLLQGMQLYYNREMPYPGSIARYRDYRRTIAHDEHGYPAYERMDIHYLRDSLKPAFDFVAEHPEKILWCGEFGTIRHCQTIWRENYMRDVILLCREHGIPYCVWNYLSTPNDGNRFSLVDDDHREIVSPRMASIISGKALV